jgi:hypothetical protein
MREASSLWGQRVKSWKEEKALFTVLAGPNRKGNVGGVTGACKTFPDIIT